MLDGRDVVNIAEKMEATIQTKIIVQIINNPDITNFSILLIL